jgi:hypothetical protein
VGFLCLKPCSEPNIPRREKGGDSKPRLLSERSSESESDSQNRANRTNRRNKQSPQALETEYGGRLGPTSQTAASVGFLCLKPCSEPDIPRKKEAKVSGRNLFSNAPPRAKPTVKLGQPKEEKEQAKPSTFETEYDGRLGPTS